MARHKRCDCLTIDCGLSLDDIGAADTAIDRVPEALAFCLDSTIAHLVVELMVIRASEVLATFTPLPECRHKSCQQWNPVKQAGSYLISDDGECKRSLPIFDKDRTVSNAKSYDDEDGCKTCRTSCRKLQYGIPKGSAGLFLFSCLEHSTILGFYFMRSEGRRDLMTPILRHFKKAPSHVVYDFACGASEYCLNRAPKFFENTTFLHDRFHERSHTACGPLFSPDRYISSSLFKTTLMERHNIPMKKFAGSICNSSLAFATLLISFSSFCTNLLALCDGKDKEFAFSLVGIAPDDERYLR